LHLIAGLVGTLQALEIYDFGAQNKAVEKCISFFYAGGNLTYKHYVFVHSKFVEFREFPRPQKLRFCRRQKSAIFDSFASRRKISNFSGMQKPKVFASIHEFKSLNSPM
jgi:hypothetical protein